jgi:predicted DNA-binding protein (MmcQ/YjbR family)
MTAKLQDRALRKLRSICLALPETCEVEAWGHPTFRAGKKLFAAFGSDHGKPTVGMRVGFERQDALLKDDRFYPTPYAARLGWVSLWIDDDANWDEVRGLLLEAYRHTANKRMLSALEAQD